VSKPLRVLCDASLASNPAGTGTYVRGLLGALKSRDDVEIVETSFHSTSAATVDLAKKTPLSRLSNGMNHLGYYLRALPRRATALNCDAIFCPSLLVPVSARVPYVMTVYDLTPLRYSSTQDWLSRTYLAGMLRWGIPRAAAICTISEAVGNEVVERFRVPRERIVVTYPGPNPELMLAQPRPAPIPERPFVLMVGTVEPRKNHLTVLRALAEHLQQRPSSDLLLVTAGSAGWRYQPVLDAIQQLGLRDRVVRLGAVEPGVLKWLYQHAQALAFPSLYEGFGLPVLEAMLLQCPVVAARIPSVAEITGDAASLLEPTDVAAWAAALDRLVDGPRHIYPPPLGEGRVGVPATLAAGLERAGRFTWEACAASAVQAIRGVAEAAS
jgi:glycosyltransferase involved in cell wall biosynthesis